MKAVYFFCENLEEDPVALHVLRACQSMYPLEPAGPALDNLPSWKCDDGRGNTLHFVMTRTTLSHEYDRHVDRLNALFPAGEFAFAGVVNWHAGANAPDRIFSYHGVGHPAAAAFAPSAVRPLRNVVAALVRSMEAEGMAEEWRVLGEATHFSGIPHGCDPATLPLWNVPQADIEIGSLPESWSDPRAARVVATALGHVFEDAAPHMGALFVGGIHFEPALNQANSRDIFFAQALTYPWIVDDLNNDDGDTEELRRRIAAAASSIRPAPEAIVFHDKAKANVKNAAKSVAADLGVECLNHKAIKVR